MASLTHVCMWSEHGWKPITAEEAAKLHPGGTVSACSGLFMCELCGQYVTLTDGDKYSRYFRHSAKEKDKDCPERTFGASYKIDYCAEKHELPIRLRNIRSNDFSLEIGLLVLPPEILKSAVSKTVTIRSEDCEIQYIYSFERLSPDNISYLSLGSSPKARYEVIADSVTSLYWPSSVEGINANGTIFDVRTGKKLVHDSDVLVDRPYYYLGTHKLSDHSPHVMSHLICEKRIGYRTWYIYEICADAFEEDAAKFFLGFHCRLTDSPVSMQPVWPPYEKTPYVIKHSTSTMYLHMLGQSGVTAKTFPAVQKIQYPCKGDGSLIRVSCGGRQQLISVGRNNVLDFTYLWREGLNKVTPPPVVKVCDVRKNDVESGQHNTLPVNDILVVDAPFDGTIKVLESGTVTDKLQLKAGVRTDIRSLKFGTKVQILQGLDIVWEAEYCHSSSTSANDEAEILRNLKSFKGKDIKISHALGSTTQYLNNYPKIKQWLYTKIKSGHMDADAFRYFKHFILEIRNK